jgi:SAM-dependent MidA family methyltransferase
MSTVLGLPGLPAPTPAPTFKAAWDGALYGPDGFYRRERPAAHFRTSVHASPLFAAALVRLTREAGLDTIVDVGAGRGELLVSAHALDPDLQLLGVEVAGRPAGLPEAIDWSASLPTSVDGLVVANEWLDNVPCHVVEVGHDGVPRILHVEPESGAETTGSALTSTAVPAALAAWCERWWPVLGADSGTRAEVGTTRDAAWADVVSRLARGLAVAVDYGHTRSDRPPWGSLRSYRDGNEVDVRLDGTRDVTADVAVDSVAAAVEGTLTSQAAALRTLGVDATRPRLDLANEDPGGYVRALSQAGEAAELTARAGLGDFVWVVTATGGCPSPL